MINMHTTDMVTLPTGDVDSTPKEMRSATADVSFQSIVAADGSVTEPEIDGPEPFLMNGTMQEKQDHFTSQLIFSTDMVVPKGIVLPEFETELPAKTDLIDEEISSSMLSEMADQSDQMIRPTAQGQSPPEMILDTKETPTEVVVPEDENQSDPVITAKTGVPAVERQVIQKTSHQAGNIQQNTAVSTYTSNIQTSTPDGQQIDAPAVGRQIIQKTFRQTGNVQQNTAVSTYTPNIQTSTPIGQQTDSSTFLPLNPAKQPVLPTQHLSQSEALTSRQDTSQPAQPQGGIVDSVYDTSLPRPTDFSGGKGQIITDKSATTTLASQQQPIRTDLPVNTTTGGGVSQDSSTTSANLATSTDGEMPQTKLSNALPVATTSPTKLEPNARNTATESQRAEVVAPQSATSTQSATSAGLQSNERLQQPTLRQTQKANQPKENEQLIGNDQSIEAPKTNMEDQNSKVQNTTTPQTPALAPTSETSQNIAADLTFDPEVRPLETQSINGPTAARQDTALNRPEVMRHVAQQMASVARQSPDRPVELILNPEELGRVRLTFTTTDGGINVAVFAERGETTELLRRHIETLAQEFRELGYKDVTFDFSGNGAGNDQNESNEETTDQTKTANQDASPTDIVAPVQLSLDPSKGLDLRL